MKKLFALLTIATVALLTLYLFKSEGEVEPETDTESQSEINTESQSTLGNMVLIPAGKFRMGTDRIKNDAVKPIHVVHIDAFYIDTHEVTVGEYERFIKESGHKKPPWEAISEISPTDQHPIVGVSWHDAMAYAKWAGKRLPTEAEWEKAARGGLMDRNYPWGDAEPDSSLMNLEGRAVAVGSHESNAFGLYDMTGNVAEWCLDPWDEDFYANSPKENPFAGTISIEETVKNYKNIQGQRVVRGSSFTQKASGSHMVAARYKAEAKVKGTYLGFRCAKDASP